MTKAEGKDLLCNGLQKFGCSTAIDKLILYKYGTPEKAAHYQHDRITTDIDFSKVPSTVRYVVKCFIHLGIYAAWPQEVCRGSGKCFAYKKDLMAMEQNPNCHFVETVFDENSKIIWFRGEEGIERFIKERLLALK